MKAITTTYHGPTNHRPARIIASDLDGNRATVPADGDFPYDAAHRAAAVRLCETMRWPGADTLIGGSVKHGRVWVFGPALVHRFAPSGQALCGSSNDDDGDAPASHDAAAVTCPVCVTLMTRSDRP